MATSISSDSPLVEILSRSASFDKEGTNLAANELNHAVYKDVRYSDQDKAEMSRWLTTAAHIASVDEDQAKTTERLLALNLHLSSRSTLLGSKPSIADVALFVRIAPLVRRWSEEELTGQRGYHHIVRHLDFVQNSSLFGLKLREDEKVKIDEDNVKAAIPPLDPKAEKERKKKEKDATNVGKAAASATGNDGTELPLRMGKKGKGEVVAAAVAAATPGVAQDKGGKKEKKEKTPKAPKQLPASLAPPLSPALIDLRVGHILKAEAHPNADSLYVSTIACGDEPGAENTSEFEGQIVRTVCSGLKAYMPLQALQGRKVVAVCNLKPVTMRGVKSCAMVLAASPRVEEGADSHTGPVELVSVPSDAKAGERVSFEGWDGEPEKTLNPKKKIWEMCQVGFTTTNDLEVAFDASKVKEVDVKSGVAKLRTAGGVCTVESLKDATVR